MLPWQPSDHSPYVAFPLLNDAVYIDAARIVSGGTKLCSIDKLFKELGLEPLQIRINKHKYVKFKKKFAMTGCKLSLGNYSPSD